MTPSEMINSVLQIKPSVLDTSALLSFLNRVEAKIRLNILNETSFTPLLFENIGTDTLLLGQQNSDIYEYYLCSQIDLHSNDIASYNNYTMMFNNALTEYMNRHKSVNGTASTYRYDYEGAFKWECPI